LWAGQNDQSCKDPNIQVLTNPAVARAAEEADSKGRTLAFNAASFFCNFRHVKQIWRKRVGVEFTFH